MNLKSLLDGFTGIIARTDGEATTDLLLATKENLPTPNQRLLYYDQTEVTDAPQYRNTRWRVDCETETDADLDNTFGYNRAKHRAKYVYTNRPLPFNALTDKEKVARLETKMNSLRERHGLTLTREGIVTFRAPNALANGDHLHIRDAVAQMQSGLSVNHIRLTEREDDLVIAIKWVTGAPDSPNP